MIDLVEDIDISFEGFEILHRDLWEKIGENTEEDIFPKTPYCVIEHSSGLLERIYPHQTKSREWVERLHDDGDLTFACAVSNLNGQTAVIRINLHRE